MHEGGEKGEREKERKNGAQKTVCPSVRLSVCLDSFLSPCMCWGLRMEGRAITAKSLKYVHMSRYCDSALAAIVLSVVGQSRAESESTTAAQRSYVGVCTIIEFKDSFQARAFNLRVFSVTQQLR